MCKRARRTPGTAEREASVAQISASVAPRTPHAGARDPARVRPQTTLPTAFSRAIDRESHAGLSNSLKSLYSIALNPPQIFLKPTQNLPQT